jgi:small subunit ribosomal protein S3
MGQKVNPVGLRLGINRTWDSRWYADDNYSQLLHEDLQIRGFLFKRLNQAGIGRIVIERPAKKARITIHTARPGVVIGKKGADIERLRTDITSMTGSDVHLNIVEIRKPEIDAKLVAENIAQQLVRRVAFRRARLSPAWPWKTRVGENSPNLWPTMFSFTSTGRNLRPL